MYCCDAYCFFCWCSLGLACLCDPLYNPTASNELISRALVMQFIVNSVSAFCLPTHVLLLKLYQVYLERLVFLHFSQLLWWICNKWNITSAEIYLKPFPNVIFIPLCVNLQKVWMISNVVYNSSVVCWVIFN